MIKFLDLGKQPLANSFIKSVDLKKKEKKFRLSIAFNKKNYLVSILNTIPKEMMFNEKYPYKSSESNTMKSSFKKLSTKIKKNFDTENILEIGSNDGPFIKNFDKKKIVGIEPCENLAKITRAKGYRTICKYWNIDLAKKISKKKKFKLIYSANTLSHIKDISGIFKAIDIALDDQGILILEDPSLLECLKNNAYDQFYCEHIYVFSTIALKEILKKYDLEIFDVENTKTHGGSNRYYIKKIFNSKIKIKKNVVINLRKERKYGLHKITTYKAFARRVKLSKFKLSKLINKLISKKKIIIGYGATAKSCTVFNYCRFNNKHIKFFYDTTSFKINKFLPGSKIEIKKYKKLTLKDTDYVYLGAWNFQNEIFKKEKKFLNAGGKFITHIPFPRIIGRS